ncbi:MAG: DUF4837 family protein [Bacteroidota bacterium]
MKLKASFYLFLVLALGISCSETNDGNSNNRLLPKATGRAGDMIIVVDSVQWSGELGAALKETFREEVGGLPREERLFKINRVDPRKLNDLLKGVKNLVFVMTLDSRTSESRALKSYFTASSIERIKKDPNIFVHTVEDEYAKGQNIMYLFSSTEKALIEKVRSNKKQIQTYFNKAEHERLKAGLYKSKVPTGLRDLLRKEHQCSMTLPFGYQQVVSEEGFIWFRQINDESDKNVFITYKDYRSADQFSKEQLIAFRDSIAMEQLFEDPDYPDTHILTETSVPYIPVTADEINFNTAYAVEMRGLWKTANLSMGGPFLGYALVDEAMSRLYYIEGFVYSPGKNQREFMREIEVILSTFRTSGQISS